MFDCEVLQRHIIDGATIVEGIMRRFRRPPLATCTLPVGVYYLLIYGSVAQLFRGSGRASAAMGPLGLSAGPMPRRLVSDARMTPYIPMISPDERPEFSARAVVPR